jgi:hypothetical protein
MRVTLENLDPQA